MDKAIMAAKFHTLSFCYYGKDSVQEKRSWQNLIKVLNWSVENFYLTMIEAHCIVSDYGVRHYTPSDYNVQAILNR